MISSKDRAGNEFKYAYNPLGNLLSKTYPDGTTDKYTYDRISRMLSAVNKDATVTFTYDKANRLLAETLNGKTTGYSYDVAAGKRTLTYPSGMKVEEHLNARDLIASILQNGNEVVTMEYNVAGQKTKQTYANGITTDYGYNENGWLSAIKDDHKVLDLAMSYDAIGNMTKRADNLDASRTESYGYDAISQLTSFTRGKTVNKTYQFDLLGNRVKTVENGVVTNYTSNNVNAYTAISGGMSFTPSYDGNGNMLNDDKHQYVYDYNSKMASVEDKSVSYKYDALGRRIAKNNTLFYYVGDQMVEESTDGTVTSYLYGNNIDEALQMSRKDEAYYYHTNHLGSTMGLSNKEGKIVEKVEYDVYGMPTFLNADDKVLAASTIGNNILFTGREYNAETGDYYFRARSMHPMVGRFMQKDPLMYVDGMNDYAYVNNSPIVFIDLLGNRIEPIPSWDNSGRGKMNSNTGGRFQGSSIHKKGVWDLYKESAGDTFNGKSYIPKRQPSTPNRSNLLGKLLGKLAKIGRFFGKKAPVVAGVLAIGTAVRAASQGGDAGDIAEAVVNDQLPFLEHYKDPGPMCYDYSRGPTAHLGYVPVPCPPQKEKGCDK